MLLHGVPGVGKTSTAGNSEVFSFCGVRKTQYANNCDQSVLQILSSDHYSKSQAVRLVQSIGRLDITEGAN